MMGVTDIMLSLLKLSIDERPALFLRDRNSVFNLSFVYSRQLCKNCLSEATSIFTKCREDLWVNLPACVNLPAWEMIKDFEL